MQVPIFKSDIVASIHKLMKNLPGKEQAPFLTLLRNVNADNISEVYSSPLWKEISSETVLYAADREKFAATFAKELEQKKEKQNQLEKQIADNQSQLRLMKRELAQLEQDNLETFRKLKWTQDLGLLLLNGVIFKCELCEFKAVNLQDLQLHMQSQQVAVCFAEDCQFRTHDQQAFFQHSTSHNKRLLPDNHPSKRQCI